MTDIDNTYTNTNDAATDNIECKTLEYPSVDGTTTIKAVTWVNHAVSRGERPRAVIQLIHGMGEHIGRYDHFARFLASQNMLVCGNDQVGHGKTAEHPEKFGLLPGDDPVKVMVDDVNQLRLIMQKNIPWHTPDVPYIMFGHSMGSLVLRCYLPRYGEGLSGAIVCGTTMPPRPLSKIGSLLARALIALKGPDAKSRVLHRLAYGVYSHKIPNARTPFDWISSDPAAVDAFINDEATGFMFSGAVYLALTDAAYDAARKRSFENIPKQLPILLVAGDEDPVGENGRMVDKVAERMRKAGVENVTTILFGGMRHEILNETGKAEVYADILSWINELLAVLADPH